MLSELLVPCSIMVFLWRCRRRQLQNFWVDQERWRNADLQRPYCPSRQRVLFSEYAKHSFCSLSPVFLRVLEWTASVLWWTLWEADFAEVCSHLRAAARFALIRTPVGSHMYSLHLWYILTAAYALMSSGAKWHSKCIDFMLGPEPFQFECVLQPFFKKRAKILVLLVAKIVENLKRAGSRDNFKTFFTTLT